MEQGEVEQTDPKKKGAITITDRCETRCADLITALLLLFLLEKEEEEEEEEKEKIRMFYSRVVDRAGLATVGTAGMVTIGTMVL